jgi:hypothetical protein
MTQGSVALGPPADPNLYSGRVVALRGTRILASATGGGQSLQLSIDVSIDQASEAVSGTVSARGSSNE